MPEIVIAAVPTVAASRCSLSLRSFHLVCGLFAAATLGLLLAAGPAAAKPKQLGVQCSAAQALKATRCLKQVQDDLINDAANPHFVACLADGSVWCCRRSTSGPGNNCTTVRTAGPGSINQVPLGNATNAPPTTNAPTAPGTFGGLGIFHKTQ